MSVDILAALTLRKIQGFTTFEPKPDSTTVINGPKAAKSKAPTGIRIQVSPIVASKNDWEKSFGRLKESIVDTLSRDPANYAPCSLQRVYTACRVIVCVHGLGEMLYDALKRKLKQCVMTLVQEFKREKYSLETFVKLSVWFQTKVALLQSMLVYLDQAYIALQPDLPTIRQLAFAKFKEGMFDESDILAHMKSSINHWLLTERTPEVYNVDSDLEDSDGDHHKAESRDTMREFFAQLVTYGNSVEFEDHYKEITQDFYTAESKANASGKLSAGKFLAHVRSRVQQEEQRARDVLPVACWAAVKQIAEISLMENRLQWLATEALGPYIDEGDTYSLASMYALFVRVGGVPILEQAFKAHILATTKKIVTNAASDDTMVSSLLEFKSLADQAINGAFLDDEVDHRDGPASSSTSTIPQHPNKSFAYALTDAFTSGFKARRNKPAELIAKHLDKAMRKGSAGDDAAFQRELNDALALYRFTDDKDVFRTFYHRALAKRLLLGKTASDDVEKGMLRKLTEHYDPEFGMGEKMFTDLTLSKDLMREYEKNHTTAGLNVMVLQQSSWPFAKAKPSVDLPIQMQKQLDDFTAFYHNRHQGRALSFDHSLCTATLKSKFPAGQKELSVSLYQAVVLLLFNHADKLSLREIEAQQSHMGKDELHRTLQSLACGKKKVLKKVPAGKDVGENDVFEWNAAFTDPRAKVHINSIQAKETPEETKRTHSSIEGDRKSMLDAAIVRIMKAEKELPFEQLKIATIEAVKKHFQPEVAAIKVQLDWLVSNDYLERGEDKRVYVYVA